MQPPVTPEDIEAAAARRPSAAPEEVLREAKEYQRLLARRFLRPQPGLDFETAEDEAGIEADRAPAGAPDGQEDARLAELHHRLFELDERGT